MVTTYWSKAEAELSGAFAFEIPNAASYRRLGFTLYNMGYGLAVLPG